MADFRKMKKKAVSKKLENGGIKKLRRRIELNQP